MSEPSEASTSLNVPLGKNRCYWAVLDEQLRFRYLDPILTMHISEVSMLAAICWFWAARCSGSRASYDNFRATAPITNKNKASKALNRTPIRYGARSRCI